MSQEAAAEEERLEVLELLDTPPTTTTRGNRNPLQQPPVRSMLDVTPGPLPARPGSIAGIGVGVTPPSERTSTAIRLSEPASSPLWLSSSVASTPTAPQITQSDPCTPSQELDQASAERQSPDVNIRSTDALSQTQNRPPSKAVQGKNAKAVAMGGFDVNAFLSQSRGRDTSRFISPRGLSLDSKVSTAGRSRSPVNARFLSVNPYAAARSDRLITEKGNVIDKDKAHRHLSDEMLSQSSGSLANLPKASPRQGSESDAAVSPGDERLEKDLYDSENNPIGTSDEESDTTSSEDDARPSSRKKGSKRDRKIPADLCSSTKGGESVPSESKPPQSLLAAAEEERKAIASAVADIESPKPELTSVDKQNSKKSSVHPQTSFDVSESTLNTPFGSDDEEELSNIKKAQKLSIQMSSIESSNNTRTSRSILRGDYSSTVEEADGIRRRKRSYLVATDLSDESVYALEWAIGTILRDGDTMVAVCAMHDENVTSPPLQTADGAKAASDSGSGVGPQTESTARNLQHDTSTTFPRYIRNILGQGSDNKSGHTDPKAITKAETDRIHTVESISETCVKLLRKTLLQVQITVEAIHCKNPKHMITDAIDGLEPTMVIVGARGTSAIKGVLLGSFSNYLVMKSSVPVMVARKKLKTQAKAKKTNIRFSNNLTTPKRLALAKVD